MGENQCVKTAHSCWVWGIYVRNYARGQCFEMQGQRHVQLKQTEQTGVLLGNQCWVRGLLLNGTTQK